ncbi:MAG: hypothetical protein SFT94_01660 [Pseudanabaenaceae cyanobacterium bins.68]|nr:hypothetical protein [Pseudanabaenaceae cyanobacterium bins.68]
MDWKNVTYLMFGLSVVSVSVAIAAPNSATDDQAQPPQQKPLKSRQQLNQQNAATLKKINNALKPVAKYTVYKSCNDQEFLFLRETTKKSGSPYWQVRRSDGVAQPKDVLVASDIRFTLVQNQTRQSAPLVLSEIRSYSTKELMNTDLKYMNCQ